MTPPDLGSASGLALLTAAGLLGGFVNTLAGGGSLVTLPALMLLGLPADMANGTNRLAILAQSAAGAHGFARLGKLDRSLLASVVVPTLLGALAGALVASALSPQILEPVIIGCLLLVAPTLLVSPRVRVAQEGPRRQRALETLGLIALGFYGGFVQLGVGILLLAYLCGVLGQDVLRANALKVTIVGAFTLVALAVFVLQGQVLLVPGLALGLGSVLGAQLAVRFSARTGDVALRRVIFGLVVIACVGLLVR
jgi:uncharacterized protein